jgi:hypothetical protein
VKAGEGALEAASHHRAGDGGDRAAGQNAQVRDFLQVSDPPRLCSSRLNFA